MLSNGLSGLNASQIALNVVSNNVANSNVAGFTRLEASFSSRIDNGSGWLNAGNGAQVDSVRRITDDYLNNSLWRSTSSYGYNSAYSEYLMTTEQLVANENLSISAGLDGLFSAFNSAAVEPSSIAPRQLVISSSQALADRFNALSANLDIQRTQIGEQVDGMIANANTLFAEVSNLNGKIVEGIANGGNVSALQDQRDETVKQLSQLMEVDVTRQQDGSMTISMSGGQPLVLGTSHATLSSSGGSYQVNIAGQSFDFNGNIGGKMGGILSYSANVLDVTEASLNTIAQQFADDINNQLAAGQDINNPPGAGQPLFSYDPLDPAGSIRVAAGFEPEDLAFGAMGAGPGDNSNLNAVIALKNVHYDDYNAMTGKLAIESSQAIAEMNASKSISDNALAQRDSVSAVNLDEEAMSLMKYQQSYQANAKVVTAADQLFDTLLSMF